ncbi:MAG: AAA family ATPase [Candidatus Aenigmatarchaeota archaeon]|nr:MAG: AAA family ATPase [Candidatus Aenigmarchaeota archaeon]
MEYNGILLSGLPSSGKSTLVKLLNERTGWNVHSIGDLWREKHAKEAPDVAFSEWWPRQPLEAQFEVNRHLRELAERQSVIADTRFAPPLDGLPLLKVFLTAEVDVRAERAVAQRRYATFEDAKADLLLREASEVDIGKTMFGADFDYRKPEHYHTALNTGLLTPKQEIVSVMALLGEKT